MKRKPAETITAPDQLAASTNDSFQPPNKVANGKETDERPDSPLPEIDFGQNDKVSFLKMELKANEVALAEIKIGLLQKENLNLKFEPNLCLIFCLIHDIYFVFLEKDMSSPKITSLHNI